MIRVAAVIAVFTAVTLAASIAPAGVNRRAANLRTAKKAAAASAKVDVAFATGGTLTAKVHANTSHSHLWIEVKSGATIIVRPIRWSQVTSVKPATASNRIFRPAGGKTQAERAHELLWERN